MRRIILIILVLIFAGSFYFLTRNESPRTENGDKRDFSNNRNQVIASDLEVPWDFVFISSEEIIVTERPGRIRLLKDGVLEENPLYTVPDVVSSGEGGLLGIEKHKDFVNNNYLFIYYTYNSSGENSLNRVERLIYKDGKITSDKVIVDEIPGSIFHNGGRLRFGPDGYLYIGTGDAQEPSLAQDRNSLAGKILRVNNDGERVSGNPFNNLIYSYGHRNVQGLAWDNENRLWATEHGPSNHDELNLIERGANYGWPEITGTESNGEMRTPIAESGFSTWAPSGLVFKDDSFYFAGLRGEALFRARLVNEGVSIEPLFENEYGRLRAVVLDDNGNINVSTSNRDGRGDVKEKDDKIIKIDLN